MASFLFMAHAGGRPSKFNTINLDKLKFLVEQKGFTDRDLAVFFDINVDTLFEWKKKHPEFSESLKDWKKSADERVERSLYERACGYSHHSEEVFCAFGKVTRVKTIKHYPPSEVACIFWLKNRQPDRWREKVYPEQSEEFLNKEVEFIDSPTNGEGKSRFAQYLQ